MKNLRLRPLWGAALVVFIAALLCLAVPKVLAMEPSEGDQVGGIFPDDWEGEIPIFQGLVVEEGKIYFYNEDGTLFTDGYKEVTIEDQVFYFYFQEDGTAFTGGYKPFSKDGKRVYYYFQEDGTAYTDGYLNFEVDGKQYYFYFQEDGSAFTGGYKEVTIDDKLCYFYFLANGQGFNTGYKTAMIDGKKYYFFFDSNGQAATDRLEAIPLGDRTAYMLFGENGRAFTGGYKEIPNDQEAVDYYYFLGNGQAFTTGYKTVKIDGVTHYYYFEDTGKAFTGGFKDVAFGPSSFWYYFQKDGKAHTSGWETIGNKTYYFQQNGRAQVGFATIDEKPYHFSKKGILVTDRWFVVGKAYYYADKDGVLATDTVKEGYKLDKNGKSTTKYRIIEYVKQHTNEDMTDQEKIKALYDWVLKSDMSYIRTYEHASASWAWKDSWVDDMATSHMDKWGGNCFRYAAFLGMLLREATGLEVEVFHGMCPAVTGGVTPHGWCTVKQDGTWYVYDVELHKHANQSYATCYKVKAEGSRLHLQGIGTKLY